jgi:hypothetical protein
MPTRICLTGIFVALFFAFAPAGAQTVIDLEKIKQFNLAEYTCLRADGEITIDGRLDEPSWQAAPWSTPFVDIVSGEPAFFDSRVKLLWDERCLYLGYRAEETHIRGTLTGRDSRIWEDNDVELFIAGKDAYYELEINALNTIYEVFWIWDDILGQPGTAYSLADWPQEKRRTDKLSNYVPHLHPRGERTGYFDFDLPGLRHAVHVDGVLNDDSVTDNAWSVELAIPWAALSPLADGRALPPQHGDIWRIDCSRFQHRGRDGALLKECAGWTWNRHGYMNSHIPETFTRVKFSTDQSR